MRAALKDWRVDERVSLESQKLSPQERVLNRRRDWSGGCDACLHCHVGTVSRSWSGGGLRRNMSGRKRREVAFVRRRVEERTERARK
jgi:hypothetical protein